MQYELKSLYERLGVTFVYVTHDQGKALIISDRVAMFSKGIVQQPDTAGSLYEHPCNEFAASFIGDNNTLRGTVTRVDGDYCGLQLNGGARMVDCNVAGANVETTAADCIRPKRMRLTEGAPVADNALAGQTRGLAYFGDHVRIRYALPDQPGCFMKVPLGTRTLEGFAPGAPIQSELVPEYLRIFA